MKHEKSRRLEFVVRERTEFRRACDAGDFGAAWIALEREHIFAQTYHWPHIRSHVSMFGFAVALRDWREVAGQLLRLVLAPLGNLTGRLPYGNTGRANVSAFATMPLPKDIAREIGVDDERKTGD